VRRTVLNGSPGVVSPALAGMDLQASITQTRLEGAFEILGTF
jgi:hypothetical protein